MGELDSEVIRWLNENRKLIEWLIDIEKKKTFGNIVLVYHNGKAAKLEISSNLRIDLMKNK